MFEKERNDALLEIVVVDGCERETQGMIIKKVKVCEDSLLCLETTKR